jgi:VWFA-related protein
MRVAYRTGLLVLWVLQAQPAASQDPAPVRETAEVTLVEVPVRVVDRDGKPVRGLSARDFTLSDDGRVQTIVGADAVDLAENVKGGGVDPMLARARRRFLILFDFSFARPKAVIAARRAAREFVLGGLESSDLVAVATYSFQQGVRLLATFSSDRVQLARAIESLGLEPPRGTSDPLAFAFDTSTLRLGGGGRVGGQAGILIESLETMASVNRARDDEYERGRVRTLIQSFRDLGQALNAVEGRKDIIYLSEGFQNRFLVGTRESAQEQQWLLQGEQWKVDADKRFGNTPLRDELTEMGRLLLRSDCVIHAVDIAGIQADGSAEAGSASFGPRETENSLYEIAHSSDGEVFRNANDLSAQLDRLKRQTSLVYVLAFRPDRAGKDGKYHELKVKVAVPGARVSARAGYFERRAFKQLTPFERNLSAADVIANEIPVDQIPARMLATAFATGEAAASVSVLLEIPGEALLAGGTGERAAAEIYVYASDQENRLADFFVQTIVLDLSKNRQKLMAAGLKYYGRLRLPPGSYRLRALVRNSETGRMGLTVASLLVPAFAMDQPYLLPPVFLEASGDWAIVRGRHSDSGGESGSWDYPFLTHGAENLSPAAEPQVLPGSPSRLCVVAYHFGADQDGDDLRLGSQILAADGRPLGEAALSVLGKFSPGADGRRALLLSFKPPEGLAPGRYGLRVFLQDKAGQARQASAPFLVR